ncbi:MAG: ATP-dependent protease subunit HslV [Deltaproteobacteria bacterium]|nr:ATP-dependent protease subunit HslV [Deltaproteobacteria bacterium]
MSESDTRIRSTTVLAVRAGGLLVMAGDGQVTVAGTIIKHRARKIRLLAEGAVLAGFAGASADAFTLFGRLEAKLSEFNNNLTRAAVELAKDWRMDKYLRRLEAMLLAGDSKQTYLISGAGDVIEPDDDVIAIGAGGPYALSAARALMKHTDLSARDVAREAMEIASSICIYTNSEFVIEELGKK